MARNRVLIIDGDDWVARLLAEGLRDHGCDVSTCLSGASALGVAQTIRPDCVVLEMILPELDGVSLARSMRADTGPLSQVPIIFISNADDIASKSAAFSAGGDVFLSKPFRVDEVALQVQAMVGMAARLKGQAAALAPEFEDAEPESMAPGAHAIEGNIEQMSVATVLTLLEMERRSGTLKVSAGARKCSLEIVAGYAIGGSIGDSTVAPLAALREILRWQAGRFRFTPGSDAGVPANRRSIGALLIEAVRLDDESTMAREGWTGEEGPTARKSWPLIAPSTSPPPSKRAGHFPPARRASKPPPPGLPRVSRPPPAPVPEPAAARQQRVSRPPPPANPAPIVPRPAPPVRRATPPPPQVPRKKS